jgi:hypothetical protein
MRRFLAGAAAVAVGVALAAAVGPAGADPAPPPVPPHRHFVRTAAGDLVQVGPDICADPSLADAFYQFHWNVHRGAANLIGFAQEQNPVALVVTGCP